MGPYCLSQSSGPCMLVECQASCNSSIAQVGSGAPPALSCAKGIANCIRLVSPLGSMTDPMLMRSVHPLAP